MAAKVKLRLTIVCDYDANPDHYPDSNGDPAAMAQMDAETFSEDPALAIDLLAWHPFTTKVEPVEVTS